MFFVSQQDIDDAALKAIDGLCERVASLFNAKIKEAVEEHTQKILNEFFDYHFSCTETIWYNHMKAPALSKDKVRASINEYIKSSLVADVKMAEQLFANKEDFVNSVVERINQKQLKR